MIMKELENKIINTICEFVIHNDLDDATSQIMAAFDKQTKREVELVKALEYVLKNTEDNDMNIRQVIRIALGIEPKIKVMFGNIGKYLSNHKQQELE